jgi:hypothetical protein
MWTWDQSAGTLSRAGKIVARGYSGKGKGKNNPEMEGVRATAARRHNEQSVRR